MKMSSHGELPALRENLKQALRRRISHVFDGISRGFRKVFAWFSLVPRQEQLKLEGDQKVAVLQEQLRQASELLGLKTIL